MSNFKLYSKYYDLLYKNKNYFAEANYVMTLAKKYKKNIQNFLELGCGTGNHAEIICEQGFEVIGIERSTEMVAIAKQKNIKNFNAIVADITSFHVDKKFDIAISLFHVISYLTDNNDLINCFKTINKHLNTEGIFIFDVWYSPAVYIQKPETRVKRMSDENIDVIRIAESLIHFNQNVVDVNYNIIIQDKTTQLTNTYTEKHPMRHFSIPEIELLAALTNFKIIQTEEFETGKTPSENTWGVCFVLQKI
ncbi:MAG: class I SAM-dependent methyltransferase [Bacteroidetes bacterium]|nr:class I SAM-dependent methyltransferase [Bacteroidota bacterium]MBS1649277.1 class I SAM-dependent methyltransferase [Bacteroidota bacterium]